MSFHRKRLAVLIIMYMNNFGEWYAEDTRRNRRNGCLRNTGLWLGKRVSLQSAQTDENKKKKLYQVIQICTIGIRRYNKIKTDTNPYMPEYGRYFNTRKHNKEAKLLTGFTVRQIRRPMLNTSLLMVI